MFNHQRCRERRLELKLTQFQVAVRTQTESQPMIRPENISKWERGHKTPNRSNCFRLATALELDPRELESAGV